MAGWDKFLEDGGEFLGDLLECSFNSLVLAEIKMLNELLNGRLRLLEFASSFQKLILLVREAVVLFKRLLVDMLVLLEGFIDLLESGGNL